MWQQIAPTKAASFSSKLGNSIGSLLLSKLEKADESSKEKSSSFPQADHRLRLMVLGTMAQTESLGPQDRVLNVNNVAF